MKMIIKPFLILAISITMLMGSSCSDKENLEPDIEIPYYEGFYDYGFIPAPLSTGVDVAQFQSLVYENDFVFAATSDGVWKVNLKNGRWARSGLKGNLITALYKHPEVDRLFFAGVKTNYTSSFKTLYISKDGGSSWKPATQPIYDIQEKRYENYICFAARPGYPNHIYANLDGGTTIAVSTDMGNTWHRMNNQEYSYFGYGSNIVFLTNNNNTIFQGSETPLDFAWLGSYEINESDPVLIQNFNYIVDHEVWSNRRPTQLKTFPFTQDNIYVGKEGSLSVVNGSNSKFIFKKMDDEFPYTYIYAVWVNPMNPSHLLFGGALNDEEQPMQLFETFDEGENVYQYSEKFGLKNPEVVDIIQAGEHPAILLNDKRRDKVKLLVYENK